MIALALCYSNSSQIKRVSCTMSPLSVMFLRNRVETFMLSLQTVQSSVAIIAAFLQAMVTIVDEDSN